MRHRFDPKGRLGTSILAVMVAVLATFAFTGAARAADTVNSEFNDSWIKLPALEALLGSVQALDPADTAGPKVNLKGDYDSATGKVSYKASEFSFPRQTFNTPLGDINLDIAATQDFTGTYNTTTGALTAQLPLKLTLDAGAPMNLKCELRPLNIGLDSSGAAVNFPTKDDLDNDLPGVSKGGSAFAPPSGAGAVIGSWTDVTPNNNVYGVAAYEKTETQMTTDCKDTIASFTGGNPDQSFDGIIWLGGVTTFVKAPECEAGQVGTPPNCRNLTDGKVGALTITKKATVKAGKSVKIKVTVKNTGEKTLSTKVALKSSNKQVKAPKSVAVSVAAGKSVTKTITVKTTKKAKGKATITASAGGKKAKSAITVKKAKR